MSVAKIITAGGFLIDLMEPSLDDIQLECIAHQLALTNRWRGATRFPISVAQHAVFVSRLCERFKMRGLHHDDHEAYFGDTPAPLKRMIDSFAVISAAEERMQHLIETKLGILHLTSGAGAAEEVLAADLLMRRYEAQFCHARLGIIRPAQVKLTSAEVEAVGDWTPWSWRRAEEQFLARHQELTQ